jgi:hypothetical protein
LTDAEQATSRSFFLTSFDPIAAISASDKLALKGPQPLLLACH